jgi:hypothetical protein
LDKDQVPQLPDQCGDNDDGNDTNSNGSLSLWISFIFIIIAFLL